MQETGKTTNHSMDALPPPQSAAISLYWCVNSAGAVPYTAAARRRYWLKVGAITLSAAAACGAAFVMRDSVRKGLRSGVKQLADSARALFGAGGGTTSTSTSFEH